MLERLDFDQIDPPNFILQNNFTSSFGESETKAAKSWFSFTFVEEKMYFNESISYSKHKCL